MERKIIMTQRVAYCLSEFIGTFAMMAIGISAVVLNFGTQFMEEVIPSNSVRLLLTGFLFAGGATLVMYSPVGRISGAHLNPAVSFAFLLEKKLGVIEFVAFSFVQILGSTIAAYLALLVWSENALKVNVAMTLPGEGFSTVFVFLVEVFITFLLVTLIFYFLHSRSLTRLAGIAVGLLIAVLVFLTAPVTGTSLNPARSIGPALANLKFSYLWLYITAPVLGSFIAVTIHKRIAFLHCPLCAKLNHRLKDKKCIYDCKFGKEG